MKFVTGFKNNEIFPSDFFVYALLIKLSLQGIPDLAKK
jgi:hypothetical protein